MNRLGFRTRLATVVAAVALCAPMTGTTAAHADPVRLLFGTVTARFTGAPVANACVSIVNEARVDVASGCTDAAGQYEIIGEPLLGSHRVRTSADGFADTWYGYRLGTDARDFESADLVFIPQGRRFDLGLRPPGIGGLRGQLTDRDQPVHFWRVTYIDVDGHHWGQETFTSEAGEYAFANLWPGHYKLRFTDDINTQYYHQKEQSSAADLITVLAGPDTVVDEQVIPPGVAEVTVSDEVTGAPVNAFCMVVPGGGGGACTTTGLIRMELARGTWFLAINPGPTHFGVDVPNVVIRSGETTTVAASARPAIAIRTTVRDALTRQPVANTCVAPIDINSPGFVPGFGNEGEECSDGQGVVTLGPLPVKPYRLLARPSDTTHGLQWVGWQGGTGDQEDARTIDEAPGVITSIPDILLDGAGSVSGTVRDEQSGQPVPRICVFPYAVAYGFGTFCTDQQGHFQVTGLGPYQWPLEFADTSSAHGWQWSGNTPDRLSAEQVRVHAGRDTTADDELLKPSASVTGLGTVEGSEEEFVRVIAFNAHSGDYAGPSELAFPDYALNNLTTSWVKIRFTQSRNGNQAWYLNATSFATATRVRVRAGQTTSGIDQVIQ